jgi:hypothetical protein
MLAEAPDHADMGWPIRPKKLPNCSGSFVPKYKVAGDRRASDMVFIIRAKVGEAEERRPQPEAEAA